MHTETYEYTDMCRRMAKNTREEGFRSNSIALGTSTSGASTMRSSDAGIGLREHDSIAVRIRVKRVDCNLKER